MIDVVLSNDNPQNHKYSLNLRAQIAIGERRYDDAWKDINKVLLLDPQFSAAHGSISYLYRSIKNYDSALNAANDSINFGKDLPYGYYQKGMLLKEQNKYEDAIEQFRLSIKYNINFFPSYNQIGLIYMDQNNYDESSKWFVRGIIVRPEFSYNYYNYGRLLLKMDRPKESLTQFVKAVDLESNNSDFILKLIETCELINEINVRNQYLDILKNNFQLGFFNYSATTKNQIKRFLENRKIHLEN